MVTGNVLSYSTPRNELMQSPQTEVSTDWDEPRPAVRKTGRNAVHSLSAKLYERENISLDKRTRLAQYSVWYW